MRSKRGVTVTRVVTDVVKPHVTITEVDWQDTYDRCDGCDGSDCKGGFVPNWKRLGLKNREELFNKVSSIVKKSP